MRRAAKVDAGIHAAIRDGLRDAGYQVFDVHSLPGRLDLDARSLSGITVALEVKHAGEPLTAAEKKYFAAGWTAEVVHSLAEALLVMQKWDTVYVAKPEFLLCPVGFDLFYSWSLALELKAPADARLIYRTYQNHRATCSHLSPCPPPFEESK